MVLCHILCYVVLCQGDNLQDTINIPIDEENELISAVKIVKNKFSFTIQ